MLSPDAQSSTFLELAQHLHAERAICFAFEHLRTFVKLTEYEVEEVVPRVASPNVLIRFCRGPLRVRERDTIRLDGHEFDLSS